ncbi:MAG: alpha/beta hydrolase [Lachnospiraceae bacterium]|nr:alpha/beta hydrolase [Lachnospiraceae bacterium]
MEERVLPYILPRREERYLSREAGQQIYCAFYTAGDGFAKPDEDRPDADVRGILLIAHGFTETADKYFEVIYYFLKAGYHVCIPEHCSHGRTYRLAGEDLSLIHTDSWQRYVDDLSFVAESAKSYWQQLPELPLFLFAHSMGGGIGAALAAQKPRLFYKAILTSPMIRPLTGGVPWPVAKLIVYVMCALGREKSYVIGQHAYDGRETFQKSCATSYVRWAWYKEKTDAEPLYQTCAASYGWLREAARLNRFLMRDGWKRMEAPVLVVQAEKETVVSKEQQKLFVKKLAASVSVRMEQIPGAKHEIFRSDDETVSRYMNVILEFLSS